MKNFIPIILSLAIFSFGILEGSDGKRGIFLGVKGNLHFPSDSGYTDVYGSNILGAGIEGGYQFYNNIYLVAGFDTFNTKGETPVLKSETESKQKFLSFGIGYKKQIGESFFLRTDAGILSVSYEEKAFGEMVDGNGLGAYIQGGVGLLMSSKFYLSTLAGYISASDTIASLKIKLGGVKVQIILGVMF